MTQTFDKPTRRATQLLDMLLRRIERGEAPSFNSKQRRFLVRRFGDLRIALDDFGDVRQALQDRREVAVVWCVEDVQCVRPNLTDDQAWEVLQECERRHDCEYGFTWTFIEGIADGLYPAPKTRETRNQGDRP